MKSPLQPALVLAALGVLAGTATAGNLQRIWEFSLNDAVVDRNAGVNVTLTVFGLSFSPTGQKIAASVGRSVRAEFLLILDFANPTTNPKKLNVNTYPWVPLGANPLSWSATGQRIELNKTIVNPSTGAACSLPQTGFFVGSDQLAAKNRNPSRLTFFDMNCQATGEWELAKDLTIIDASAERGLLLIGEPLALQPTSVTTSVTVVEATTRKTVQTFSLLSTGRFADSGKAVCGVTGSKWHRRARCWDVDSGKLLSTRKGPAFIGITPALHAKRAILSEWSTRIDLDGWWYPGSVRQCAVWDFQTGKQLVSWRPPSRDVSRAHRSGTPRLPAPCAISPDGEYLVESSSGVLRLYRIEP